MILEQEKEKELRSVTYIMQDENQGNGALEKKPEKLYDVIRPRKTPVQDEQPPKNDKEKIEEFEKAMSHKQNDSPYERSKSAIQDPMVASADKK